MLSKINSRLLNHKLMIELLRKIGIAWVLIGLIFFGILTSPNFLTTSNIDNLLRTIAIIGILGIGETFVILGGEIDLSIGSVMLLSLVIGEKFLAIGVGYAIFLSLASGIILGVINGTGVVFGKVRSIIMTICMMFTARGIAYLISKGQAIYLWKYPKYLWLGKGYLLGIAFPILFYLLFIFTSWFVSEHTLAGYRIFSVGGNKEASWWSGINVGKWKIITFAIAGFSASFAGIIQSGRLGVIYPSQGMGSELWAISVVVLGGTSFEGGVGSIYGTVIGTLIIGVVINVLNLLGFSVYFRNIILGIVIILALIKRGR